MWLLFPSPFLPLVFPACFLQSQLQQLPPHLHLRPPSQSPHPPPASLPPLDGPSHPTSRCAALSPPSARVAEETAALGSNSRSPLPPALPVARSVPTVDEPPLLLSRASIATCAQGPTSAALGAVLQSHPHPSGLSFSPKVSSPIFRQSLTFSCGQQQSETKPKHNSSNQLSDHALCRSSGSHDYQRLLQSGGPSRSWASLHCQQHLSHALTLPVTAPSTWFSDSRAFPFPYQSPLLVSPWLPDLRTL